MTVDNGNSREFPWRLGLLGALGVGALVLLAFTVTRGAPIKSTAVGLLIAGSAVAVGIFTGFLFGIPRTLQREPPANAPPPAAGAAPASAQGYGANTNLEQISDWLTKIIVGVGLVELATVSQKFQELTTYLATAFDGEAVSSSVIGLILVYFGVIAFLLGYLWTRLYLTSEFSRAERAAQERPEFYEGMIHAFLYQPKPDGFNNAIRYAEEYQLRFGPSSARVWMYLACAYAQRYSYLKADPSPDNLALDTTRKQALEAVQRVLQINPADQSWGCCWVSAR